MEDLPPDLISLPIYSHYGTVRPSLLKFLGKPLHLQIFHLLANSTSSEGRPVYWDKRVITSLLEVSQGEVHTFFNRLRELRSNPFLREIYESNTVPAQNSYLFTVIDGVEVPVDHHPRAKKVQGYRLLKSQYLFEFSETIKGATALLTVDSGLDLRTLSLIASLLSFLSNPALQKMMSCFHSLDDGLSLNEISDALEERDVEFRRRTFYESIRLVNEKFPPQVAPLKIELDVRGGRPHYRISPTYLGLIVEFRKDLANYLGLANYGDYFYVSKLIM